MQACNKQKYWYFCSTSGTLAFLPHEKMMHDEETSPRTSSISLQKILSPCPIVVPQWPQTKTRASNAGRCRTIPQMVLWYSTTKDIVDPGLSGIFQSWPLCCCTTSASWIFVRWWISRKTDYDFTALQLLADPFLHRHCPCQCHPWGPWHCCFPGACGAALLGFAGRRPWGPWHCCFPGTCGALLGFAGPLSLCSLSNFSCCHFSSCCLCNCSTLIFICLANILALRCLTQPGISLSASRGAGGGGSISGGQKILSILRNILISCKVYFFRAWLSRTTGMTNQWRLDKNGLGQKMTPWHWRFQFVSICTTCSSTSVCCYSMGPPTVLRCSSPKLLRLTRWQWKKRPEGIKHSSARLTHTHTHPKLILLQHLQWKCSIIIMGQVLLRLFSR